MMQIPGTAVATHLTFYAVHQNGRSLKLRNLYDVIAIALYDKSAIFIIPRKTRMRMNVDTWRAISDSNLATQF